MVREHRDLTLDVDVDVLTRISLLLSIHQALGILHPTERGGTDWLRMPQETHIFGGNPPLELTTSGT